MQPTLDGTWAWLTMDSSACNPFGSFRQEGTFPESLFANSMLNGHQPSSPANASRSQNMDTIQEDASGCAFDDSTHLYMNTMDRSDVEDTKTTRFWIDRKFCERTRAREQDKGTRSDAAAVVAVAASDVVTITSTNRHGSVTVDCVRKSTQHARNTDSSSSSSRRTRPLMKTTKSSSALRAKTTIKDQNTTIQRKVRPWIQSLPTPCTADHGDLTLYRSRGSLSSSGSSNDREPVLDRGQPSGASDSETDFHLPNTRNAEISMDSDATFFMQHPLVNRGVKRRKMASKRRNLARKIRHFGRMLTDGSDRSKISTLAVL